MKGNRTVTIITLAALAALALVVFRGARGAQAQTGVPNPPAGEQPPPVSDRLSFGMVGITRGQTVRVSVANLIAPDDSGWPPGPTRVAFTFVNGDGQLFRNRDGSPVRRVASLGRGQSAFLDLDADDLQWPPGPTRLQLRAVVHVQPPPFTGDTNTPPPIGDRTAATVEVFNNSTGRTVVFIGNPGIIRGFNPQPDPPVGD